MRPTVADEAVEVRGIQNQDDGLYHFFETCCTQPNFRTLCGKSVILTRKVRHTDGLSSGKPRCSVCADIARTPFFCRKCGARFMLPS